jgi:hypothetical protein
LNALATFMIGAALLAAPPAVAGPAEPPQDGPPAAYAPIDLHPLPPQAVVQCRLAQATTRHPILCPRSLPRATLVLNGAQVAAPIAERVLVPGRGRKRPAAGLSFSYGFHIEPESGPDWRSRLWQNRPCCFLHVELYRRFPGIGIPPPGARLATLGGRRGIYWPAVSWGMACRGNGGVFCNHAAFLFWHANRRYLITIHHFARGETRALLDRIVAGIVPARQLRLPAAGDAAETAREAVSVRLRHGLRAARLRAGPNLLLRRDRAGRLRAWRAVARASGFDVLRPTRVNGLPLRRLVLLRGTARWPACRGYEASYGPRHGRALRLRGLHPTACPHHVPPAADRFTAVRGIPASVTLSTDTRGRRVTVVAWRDEDVGTYELKATGTTRGTAIEAATSALVQHAGGPPRGGDFDAIRSRLVLLDAQSLRPRRTLRVHGAVTAIAPDGAGGWYVAGPFDRIDGMARAAIARIGGDGQVDRFFRGSLSQHSTANAFGINALRVAGGRVYALGSFWFAGGAYRPGLAALDARTGRPDRRFRPPQTLASGTDLLGDGDHLLVATARGVVRLDARTGRPRPPSLVRVGPAGEITTVTRLAETETGDRLIIGGTFRRIQGKQRASLAAVDGTGRADPVFRANLAPLHDTCLRPCVPVYDLALDPRGLYVAGFFRRAGGRPHRGLARLDPRTAQSDPSWAPRPPDPPWRLLPLPDLLLATVPGHRSGLSRLAAFDLDTGGAVPPPLPDLRSISAVAVDGSDVAIAATGLAHTTPHRGRRLTQPSPCNAGALQQTAVDALRGSGPSMLTGAGISRNDPRYAVVKYRQHQQEGMLFLYRDDPADRCYRRWAAVPPTAPHLVPRVVLADADLGRAYPPA